MTARIDAPALPPRLYRYRSLTRTKAALDQELSAIVDGYIYCSEFTRLNDPMEGSYNPTTLLEGKKDYKRVVEAITEKKVDLGIASFSEVKHSELMWAHYADNHAGICVSYYPRNLRDALSAKIHMLRVGYFDEPPLISASEADLLESATRKIFAQKKIGWQYEREWRVLGPKGKVWLDEDYNVITAVYLGTKIAPVHRRAIIGALRPHKIPLWEMKVDGYNHFAKRLLYAPRKT
ncbi:MAG: hypothetical protein QOF14_829 [Hyphomicrobiales bacterium]|jgi:hypothetical protein|nr:hypothetical protein [Hyphomicrobiales bacterium]